MRPLFSAARTAEAAWGSAWGLGRKALRRGSPNFPDYVCYGFDYCGREIEIVGTATDSRRLVYHAMTPPSGNAHREMDAISRRAPDGNPQADQWP